MCKWWNLWKVIDWFWFRKVKLPQIYTLTQDMNDENNGQIVKAKVLKNFLNGSFMNSYGSQLMKNLTLFWQTHTSFLLMISDHRYGWCMNTNMIPWLTIQHYSIKEVYSCAQNSCLQIVIKYITLMETVCTCATTYVFYFWFVKNNLVVYLSQLWHQRFLHYT